MRSNDNANDKEAGREVDVGALSHLKYGETIGSGVTGFLTGFLGSMAGVGGGPFCVPLLGWLLGLNHKKCVGTSILCGLTTLTVGGLTAFLSASSLHIPVIPIFVLAVVAPGFGFLSAKGSNSISPFILKQIFAWFLLFCALQIVWGLAYSPTGVEGHWQYTLETSDGRHQRHLVYEIEPIEGELIFRTEHFGGILKKVREFGGQKQTPKGFEDGWFTVLQSKGNPQLTQSFEKHQNRGTMWVRVLDRGTTMQTVYQSTDHFNVPVVATRKKSWIATQVEELVQSDVGNAIFHLGIAIVAGTASGLLGIAGGSVVVPLMSLTGAFPWQTITTTSLLSMIPTSLTTCYTHHLNGNVALRLAPGLVGGTIVGAFTGSRLMAFTTEVVRKTSCAGVLLFTACIMLYQGANQYLGGFNSEKAILVKMGTGVIFFYCLAALLQEKVFNLPEFSHEFLLTFTQSVMICCFSLYDLRKGGSSISMPITPMTRPEAAEPALPEKEREAVQGQTTDRKVPIVLYLILAVLSCVSGVCTNRASKLLDYTTQVVFKSSKLPWMMVWRVLFLRNKRRPSIIEWICAIGLSGGLAIFVMAGATLRKQLGSDYWSGLTSILVALACDASIYALEEGLVFAKYKADKLELILYLSALSVPVSFLLLVQSGSLSTSWLYLRREWRFPTLVISYAACNYIGTKFVLQIVQEYDSNMAVLSTSLRKAATIILSYAFFPKPITSWHVLGLAMVGGFTYGHINSAELSVPPKGSVQRERDTPRSSTVAMQLA